MGTYLQVLVQDVQLDLLCLLVCGICSPITSRVSNTCTSSRLQSRYWTDERGGLWCQQGPLLPHGREGGVREPVRALHREDLLHTEQGVLYHKALQKLHGCH